MWDCALKQFMSSISKKKYKIYNIKDTDQSRYPSCLFVHTVSEFIDGHLIS